MITKYISKFFQYYYYCCILLQYFWYSYMLLDFIIYSDMFYRLESIVFFVINPSGSHR